ncbi:helix-turn-helix domain-containing protein [Clostridium sp. MT-14]|uniref:AlbA family DNA-binding domain-containing protein n=1 Tax=Clostridium sp. MT-14 TaxID=3348360 RepID=UPI0035F4AE3A
MNRVELLNIIENGENSYIEFKEEGIKAKELAEEIVAFANSEGGTILIGVSDDGKIKGITDKNIEEKIMNVCRNNCIPNIIPVYPNATIANTPNFLKWGISTATRLDKFC